MAYDIGAKIGIEGEAEFKQAIRSIDTGLKTLNTELKANAAAYDRNDKSIKNLSTQNTVLIKSIDTQKTKVAELKIMVEKSTQAYGENSAETQKYTQQLNMATAALNKAELQHRNNEKAIKNHNTETVKATMQTDEMKKAQERLRGVMDVVKGAIIAVAGALALSTKAAIDYESAFAGVRKTVDGTDEELAKMSDGIRAMSKDIPVAATDLASIAENAGQLGIKKDSILGFTRVMADLGVATNLTGEEAAQTLAKFANIMQMPQSEFDKLGSTIVDLGNNLATTEADIAAMALRLAGAGNQVGMTEAQILSFAGALSSVGIEAEMGGSAFSKVMLEMQMAAQTGEKAMTGFAQVAGMSAKNFKSLFEKDATGAIISFIEGLGKLDNASLVLENLDMKEVRLRDTLLRASGAGNVFRDAIALGTKAWEENVALTNEATKRYETTASQMQILKNTVVDAAITIGNSLLPQIQNLTAGLKNADLTPIVNGFKWIIDNGATILSIITGIGAGMLVWNVSQTIFAVVQAIQIWRGAMETAKIAQIGLNVAMASNPIGLVVTAIAALTAGLVTYKIIASQTTSVAEELNKTMGKQRQSYEDITKTIEESQAADLSKTATAKVLTDELYNLNEQVKSGMLSEEDAIETKRRMHTIADQLRKLMPDVAIEFDNETGSIITQKGEIEKLIDSYQRLAIAKAYQAKLDLAAQKFADAETNKKEALKNRSGAQYNVDYFDAASNSKTRPTAIGALFSEDRINAEAARKDLDESTKAFSNAFIAADEAQAEMESLSKEIVKYTDATDTSVKSTDNLGKSTLKLADDADKSGKKASAAAKAATKAEKEAAKEAKEVREKRFKDLKFNLDMGYITEKQYYDGLETLRDTYFSEGSDDWQKYTMEIYNYQKETFEKAKKDITETFDEITKKADDKMKEVESARNNLEKRLNDYANLFQKVRITGGGETTEFLRLGDIKKANSELENYRDLLNAVKQRGAGDELFSILRDMSPEEATANAKQLLSVSDADFNTFINDLKTNRELNAGISDNLFSDDVQKVKEEYQNELYNTLSGLTSEYSGLGTNYAKAIGEGFISSINEVFAGIREELTKQMNGIDTVMSGFSVNGGGNVTNSTYAPTINIQGGNMTPAQSMAASSRQYLIDKIRGLIK